MPAARRAIPIQPLPASAEWHIAGIVVHALPDRLAQVRAAIEAIAGAEIHAVSDSGKLVVTLEAPSSRAIAAHLTFLHQFDGVLSAALVYQHNEDAEAMHEAVNPAMNEEAGT
ncbi:chaperone NapD [Cupriavidus taiwanensis]|uniref:Chaperone NapD n=1 Tax=Cupriavidus taiwanensis TaxID=164546 RepID=A0A375IL76_9BURK|nr:chaperone NapD [Cupriavidus taiwanensis]SOY72692.1 Periplasmic nitrate reductase accessory protein [Cupriavidus taiwanensis]SOY72885.1 Periplasmic nitrate reductase accessory protein [Cupriavidus taiwanensis]SOY96842.1 Periplasmic nitrate reductase accessory protein [Cupriavidus taiwanensis]SOZ30806.1 Periplasmic nitrate reductase accessory protein [Cupriavidus taiwanensis]SOZ66765.1 Periplasmic nitrate reductase accessory protein [Cupriavidus taiwanensis]